MMSEVSFRCCLLATLLLAGCVERKPLTVVNDLPYPVRVEFNGMIAVARVNPGDTVTTAGKVTVRPVNHIAVIKLPDGRPPVFTAEFAREDVRSRWYDGQRVKVQVSREDLRKEER